MTFKESLQPDEDRMENFPGTDVPRISMEGDEAWLALLSGRLEVTDDYITSLNHYAEVATSGEAFIEKRKGNGLDFNTSYGARNEAEYRAKNRKLFYGLLGTTSSQSPLYAGARYIEKSGPINVIANARLLYGLLGSTFPVIVEEGPNTLASRYKLLAHRVKLAEDNGLSMATILMHQPRIFTRVSGNDDNILAGLRRVGRVNTAPKHLQQRLRRAQGWEEPLAPATTHDEGTLSEEQRAHYIALARVTGLDRGLLETGLAELQALGPDEVISLRTKVEELAEEKEIIRLRDVQKLLSNITLK